MNEAVLVRNKTMPLNQQVEHRHGEGQAHFKIVPNPVGKVFEMRDDGEHGQEGLNEHPRIPFTAFAGFEVWATNRV